MFFYRLSPTTFRTDPVHPGNKGAVLTEASLDLAEAQKVQGTEGSGRDYGDRFLGRKGGSLSGFYAERNNNQLRKLLRDSQETSASHLE